MKKTFVPEQKENLSPLQQDQAFSLFIDRNDRLILRKRAAVLEKNRSLITKNNIFPSSEQWPQDEFEKEILEKFF